MKMATYKIKDICDVINGRAYLQPELQKTGKYRILRVGNFFSSDRWYYSDMELTDNKYCCEGDLLFAWSASFGPKIWHGDKTIYHYHIWKMVPHEEVDKYYLYYWLRMSVDNLTAGTHGSVMAHMTKNDMENFFIDLPDKKTQEGVAAILATLDSKIECNAQTNRNLEQQAQAIFKSWFVDFEPFQDGRFVDSELGPIPDGWRVGTMGDVIELHDSKRVPLSGSQREKMRKIYPYYGASSLMDYVEDYLFDGIYTLLGEDGTVVTDTGMPVLQYVWGKFWVNNHAHILTGKIGHSPETLYILLSNTPVKSIVTGAVQPKISQANLKSIPIVIAPKEQILKYKELIDPLFAKVRENHDESNRLATLRDTLLPRLMSGEIDVSEVEV